MQPKYLLRFLARFVVAFAVLAVPWPGWPETFAAGFRGTMQGLFNHEGSKSVVMFKPYAGGERTLDSVILLANRAKLDPQARGNAASFPFSCRHVVYLPAALCIALVLASPVSVRRRAGALVGGLIGMALFAVLLVKLMLASLIATNTWLELPGSSPFGQRVLAALFEVFLTYLGARFAVAVLLWIGATFRREDWERLLTMKREERRKAPHRDAPPRK
jgi:hypothetical protein